MNFVLYQLTQIAAALLMGMLLAFYYDVYRLMVIFFNIRKALLAFFDLLWWLSVLVLFGLFWYVLLAGDMRLVLFLWQGLGFGFFRIYFSPGLRKVEKKLQPPGALAGRQRKAPRLPAKLAKALALPAKAIATVFDFLGKAFWLMWESIRQKPQKLPALRLFRRRKKPPPDDNGGN